MKIDWKPVLIIADVAMIFIFTTITLVAYHNSDLIMNVVNIHSGYRMTEYQDESLSGQVNNFKELYSATMNLLYFSFMAAFAILSLNIVWLTREK